MKPVAILQFNSRVGPGHFADFLARHAVPSVLLRIDQADPVPAAAGAFSGICLLGGPMSANDDLPWIEPVLALIRNAVASATPLIGHCLGAQLMSRALGGVVCRNPVREIGWSELSVSDSETARHWLGGVSRFDAFQWHGDTFSLPAGAEALLHGLWCANQAYALGPHIGLQCHVEATEAIIRDWTARWYESVLQAGPREESVQNPEQILAAIESCLPAQQAVADHLYSRWIAGFAA